MNAKAKTTGSVCLQAALLVALAAQGQGCEELQPIGTRPASSSPGPASQPASQAAPRPAVRAVVLTDRRCKACGTEGLIQNLRGRFFSTLKVETLDYGDAAGRELFTRLGLRRLPALLFEPEVERHASYQQLARWITPRGRYRQLQIRAEFDPTAEICDNGKDDTGDGAVDCADRTCKEQVVCRQEIGRRLEVFVMSQCPYGVKALDALQELLPAFAGDGLSLDVHYIATKTPEGIKSLHGPTEVAENMRQLCAKKHYRRGNRYLRYIWCRNKSYRSSDWKPCATDGISAAVIERCVAQEGTRLLEQDIRLAEALAISGSPTWLANNRHTFGGIAPEPIKGRFCQHNPGLRGCARKLSGQAAGPAPGACGQ